MANSASPTIFVVGTASLDTLHLANNSTAQAAGGAGLYTALAAQRTSTAATLFAPKPSPMPAQLAVAHGFLAGWIGPAIEPHQMPRLEIAHHGQGRATLLDASWGAEGQLTPATLPDDLAPATLVHIAALSSAERQLQFVKFLKQRGVRVSVGTYARLVYNSPDVVRELVATADIFFMNQNEATGLFGAVESARARPGALLFVTLDATGALVIEAGSVTHVAGHPVPEVDPTGAGDTFCGATLAGLAQGVSPVAAAEQAVKLAARTVAAVGPAALLEQAG